MLEEPEQDVYGDAESGVRVPPSMPQVPLSPPSRCLLGEGEGGRARNAPCSCCP